MSETAEKAKSLFESPKPYHPAARLTLPVLVRQARASETIQYSAVAAEVGVSRPRNMGYPLGSIGQTLLELGRRWRQTIPPIQAIVVNKADGLPGVGVAHFTPDAKAFKSATRQQKRRIVLEILLEVFTYRDWDRVLRALGLQPLSTPELPPVAAIAGRSGGEGPEHLALKQLISECPHSVGAEGMTPEVEGLAPFRRFRRCALPRPASCAGNRGQGGAIRERRRRARALPMRQVSGRAYCAGENRRRTDGRRGCAGARRAPSG